MNFLNFTNCNPSRAEAQEIVDTLFVKGEMNRADWVKCSQELSDPFKWTKEGRVA